MKNKHLILALLALTIASCSSHKKDAQTNTTPKPATTAADAKSLEEAETKIFSVPAEEVKKSGQPHVVYFATNSAKLDKKAVEVLASEVLAEAKNSKTKRVVIEAHCDERGTTAYNKKLSEQRAKAVKKYLVKNGVKSVKIKTVGYGKSKPVALGHDEASWSKNRRAVTISIKK